MEEKDTFNLDYDQENGHDAVEDEDTFDDPAKEADPAADEEATDVARDDSHFPQNLPGTAYREKPLCEIVSIPIVH